MICMFVEWCAVQQTHTLVWLARPSLKYAQAFVLYRYGLASQTIALF